MSTTHPLLETRVGARSVRGILHTLLIAVAYVVSGWLGLQLADVQANATLIWAPTGISIAGLLLLGPRVAPGVFAGAFLVNLAIGTAWAPSIAIACGNTLEALLGWGLLRWSGFDPHFRRMRDVGLLLACALVPTLVSALVGVSTLVAADLATIDLAGSVGIRWWLGDAAGAVVFLPLITLGVGGVPSWHSLLRNLELWALLLATAASSALTFLVPADVGIAPYFGLLTIPLVVWSGARTGPRGAVLTSAVATGIAIVGTGLHLGPFAEHAFSQRIFALWAHVTTLGAVALVLAAAVSERQAAADRALAEERARRQLEAQMQHVQRLESLGVLAGGVAHDFNNLLTVITITTSLAEDEPDQMPRHLTNIETAALRASSLCDQLLTYAGDQKARAQPVDLSTLVQEMASLLRSSVSREIDLDLSLDGTTPPVAGDPALLRQIFLNLILNASEAYQGESGQVRVRAAVAHWSEEQLRSSFLPSEIPAGPYIVLTVCDDGIGMDEETLTRAFDPFFTTKFAGRGLGLAAVLGAVRSHDGGIKVRSTPGSGTTFQVLLPPAPDGAREVPQPRVFAIEGHWLVVDDEVALRQVTALTLESLGAQTTQATDGDEAVAWLEEHLDEVDGLIVDLTMPGRSGNEVRDWVAERRPELPIVLMSGYSDSNVPDGVVFLPKPFTRARLSEAIRRAVTR